MRIACAPADVVARVRVAQGDAVVVEMVAGDPLDLALARAAVPALARERAPMRVNAVVVHDGADPADVARASAYLASAAATSGQVLEVQPRVRPHGPSEASTNA